MLFYPSITRVIMVNSDINQLVQNWCLSMDSITHHDRRKIAALLFLELLENQFLHLETMVNPVICSVLEVLTDLGTRKLKSSVQDNLVLTEVRRIYKSTANT